MMRKECVMRGGLAGKLSQVLHFTLQGKVVTKMKHFIRYVVLNIIRYVESYVVLYVYILHRYIYSIGIHFIGST